METSQLRRREAPARGFTLVEVLVATLVLSIGMVALSGLVAQMALGTERARFMGLAANLASEKLEDLNRWPVPNGVPDPTIYAAAGTTVGSLSSDVGPVSVTSGFTENVNYYDDVQVSDSGGTADSGSSGTCGTNGSESETITTLNGSTTQYLTTYHCADGEMINATATSSPVASETNAISFHRRWTIESNPSINGTTITGVRRVTVEVTLLNAYMQPPVSFQMSLVRP
jgi:prepilin-type N-terminal cleavage/methylation domain-containing protein